MTLVLIIDFINMALDSFTGSNIDFQQ